MNEYAKDYVPSAITANVAELQSVPVDIDLIDDSFEFEKDGETKVVNQKVIVVEDVKYRVPVSVIKQLKVFLAEMPSMKHFRVKKTGTTKADTIYTVIPLTE